MVYVIAGGAFLRMRLDPCADSFFCWQVGQAIGALAAKGVVSLKSLAQYVLEAESPDAEPREENEDTGGPPSPRWGYILYCQPALFVHLKFDRERLTRWWVQSMAYLATIW